MRQYNNSYIIGFATAVCLVCSIVVSTSAVALRERQDRNKVLDRQTKVLVVAGLLEEGQKATAEQVEGLFNDNIRIRAVDLASGEYDDAVDVNTYDQRKAEKDPDMSRAAPPNNAGLTRVPDVALVYQKVEGDQVEMLILPVEGKGLWSTLYGFLALAPDTTTIDGITFYEHGETPGLGGGVAITVIKGAAGSAAEDPYHVDGLSGATLTARGVSHLVQFWLGKEGFGPYLEKFRAQQGSVS